MNKILVGFLLIVLAACNQQSASDNYVFEGKQFEHKQVEITVVTYKTETALQNAAAKDGEESNDTRVVKAFTVLNPYDNKCTIHIMDPAVKYQPEYAGHEFIHCIYGQFHPSQM